MAKVIKYKFLSCEVNHGTEEEPNIEQILSTARIVCPTQAVFDANYPIAEKEAVPGSIEVTGEFDHATAPNNILAGEYVTIDGVLYLATENIPNGEQIIVGQNAVVTTMEAQLLELKGE